MAELAERLASALADRYRIERELSAGGMATVYLAEDLRHHRKVALKVFKPEFGRNATEKPSNSHSILSVASLTPP